MPIEPFGPEPVQTFAHVNSKEMREDLSDKLKIRFRELLKNRRFQANPIQYVLQWKEEHPEEQLLQYDRFSYVLPGRRCGAGFGSGPKTEEARCIVEVAKRIMAQGCFVSSFVDWLKRNAQAILKDRYSNTDERVLEIVLENLNEKISTEQFKKDLSSFRDVVVHKVKLGECEKKVVLPGVGEGTITGTDYSPLGSLDYIMDRGGAWGEKSDLVTGAAMATLDHAIRNYFDLTYTPRAPLKLRHPGTRPRI